MLKINLLPKSIDIARQRNIAIGVVAVLVAAEIGALLYMRTGPEAERARLMARKQEADGQLSQLQGIGTQANAVLAEEAGLAPKYDFITKTLVYNKAYPELYRKVTGYTYAEVMFLNLQASSNQLTFDAYVSNPTDVSRLMLGLSRSPIIQGLPVVTGVPGWDAEEQAQRRREEQQQAREEALPGAGTGIIGGIGMGDAGASAPGMEGAPGIGGPPAGYPGGAGKGLPGAAGVSGGGSYPGAGGGGGYPGAGGGGGGGYPGGGGQGGGGGDISRLRLDAAKLKPRGFTINVTVPLRTPIPGRPSYDTSDQQAGTAGGGGGMGGMGGGMPGGYPGMGGGMPGGGGYPGM